MGVPYRVFFSHAGEDKYVVDDWLKPKVEATGAYVFLDIREIQYGDNFRETIFSELRQCDELLVLLTKSALRRPWIFAEIGAAIMGDKRIVAVRYGVLETELQESGVMSLIGSTNLLQLKGNDFEEYVSQLKLRVEEVSQ